MTVSTHRCTSYHEALERACEAAAELVRRTGRVVLLAPDCNRVDMVKRTLASMGYGMGVQVETPGSWVADLWELYGTGARLSTSLNRDLLLRSIVGQGDQDIFAETDGMICLLSDLARDGLPFFLKPIDDQVLLSPSEAEILRIMESYALGLQAEGLIESSQVAAFIAENGYASNVSVVVWNCTTTMSQDLLLESALCCQRFDIACCEKTAAQRSDELAALSATLYHPQFDKPLTPEGKVRFVLPAGRYASAELMAQALAACGQRLASAANADSPRSIAVACRDPYTTFQELAPRLRARGLGARLQAQVSLGRTAFGIAWTNLLRFMENGCHATASLASDFAYSLFSFMDASAAAFLDARMRGWRGETLEDALTDMSAYSQEGHRDFLLAVEEGRLTDALALQRAWISTQQRWPEAFRALQLAAVDAATAIHEQAQKLGLSRESALAALNTHAVSFACQVLPGEEPQGTSVMVHFVTQRQLAAAEPGAFDACMLADLSADAYPVADEPRAADALLRKLGAFKERKTVDRIRADFSCAIAAARHELLFHRCLNTVDAEEDRPSALFDEVIDCYRNDPQNADELHKVLGVPASLLPFTTTMGEERIGRLSFDDGELPALAQEFEQGPADRLIEWADNPGLLLAPKIAAARRGEAGHLSASAIEAYLECPYKWFASRRLGTESLDAQLGPRERGNFAHKVLQHFHDYLHEQGLLRVTPENAEEVLPVFDQLFEALLENERTLFSSDAYFPLNNFERIEVARFKDQLRAFIRWEAELLPGYHPLKGEIGFGKADQGQEPFMYAGVPLVGSIDRVDVDDYGRAVVLDYKGSVGASYEFRVKDAPDLVLPTKVQALIYAQVVRRQLGLTPVGALYVSYGARHSCAGLYDETLLSPQSDLLRIKPECCGSSRFLDDLDWVEEEIGRRLQGLLAGVVAPSAAASQRGACGYCVAATVCPKQGGAR